MNKVWKTQDGRFIEYGWMQSQHLVHAINLVLRQSNIDSEEWYRFRAHRQIGLGLQEIEARGLDVWANKEQLSVPSTRETPVQLCMLRALLDGRPRASVATMRMFYANPDKFIDAIQRYCTGHEALWARFIAYRMVHGDQT